MHIQKVITLFQSIVSQKLLFSFNLVLTYKQSHITTSQVPQESRFLHLKVLAYKFLTTIDNQTTKLEFKNDSILF